MALVSTGVGSDNAARKLYIANLPPGFSKADLESAFAAYGVEDVVMHNRCNREDGRLSAFVILTAISGAQYAVDSMQGWCPDGVSPAVVRMATSAAGGVAGGGLKRPWAAEVPQQQQYAPPQQQYAVNDLSQRRIYCANLPPDVDDAYVRSVFASFGNVQDVVLLPQKTTSMKRAVVVVMAEAMGAESAIASLQGWCPIEGSPETVVIRLAGPPSSGAVASPPPPQMQMQPGMMQMHPGMVQQVVHQPAPQMQEEQGTKVYVSGLPSDCSEEWVRSYFSEVCGAVRDVKVLRTATVSSGRLSGFVGFLHQASVQAALSLNGALLPDGAVLHVRPPLPRGGRAGSAPPAIAPSPGYAPQPSATYPPQPPGAPPGYQQHAYQHNPYAYQQHGGWQQQPPGLAPQQVPSNTVEAAPPAKRSRTEAEPIKGTARTPIKLNVTNLDPSWDEGNVSALFSQFGEVIETELEAGTGVGAIWIRGAPAATTVVSQLDGKPCGNAPMPMSITPAQ